MADFCVCGCGRKLKKKRNIGSGRERKYATMQCQYRYKEGLRLAGKLKPSGIKICINPLCRLPFYVYPHKNGMKCCGRKYTDCTNTVKRMKIIAFTRGRKYTQESSIRPKHIHIYCHQGWHECKKYSDCLGTGYTGDCFIKPRPDILLQAVDCRMII